MAPPRPQAAGGASRVENKGRRRSWSGGGRRDGRD
jgi:hypothetical protein